MKDKDSRPNKAIDRCVDERTGFEKAAHRNCRHALAALRAQDRLDRKTAEAFQAIERAQELLREGSGVER